MHSNKIFEGKVTYGSNYVCSKKTIGCFVTKNLDHAIGIIVCLGAAVGSEGEFTNFVFNSLNLFKHDKLKMCINIRKLPLISSPLPISQPKQLQGVCK